MTPRSPRSSRRTPSIGLDDSSEADRPANDRVPSRSAASDHGGLPRPVSAGPSRFSGPYATTGRSPPRTRQELSSQVRAACAGDLACLSRPQPVQVFVIFRSRLAIASSRSTTIHASRVLRGPMGRAQQLTATGRRHSQRSPYRENHCENQTFANRGKWGSMVVSRGRSRLMRVPDHGMKMSRLLRIRRLQVRILPSAPSESPGGGLVPTRN
jgi:hypothetical protein